MRSGEIVEVQGGRKERQSKVCTAKGTRDRRLRLSALTAIQFYDVQDRLGYDRPTKAVDWLITKAKASIDALARLPPTQNPNRRSIHVQLHSDSINSFFPMPAPPQPPPHSQFHDYPLDLPSTSQDLRLSLQGPNFLHHHHRSDEPTLFSGSAAGWSDVDRFQRMVWNNGGADNSGGGAFMLSSPATPQPLIGGQNQFYSQRGPLQSSSILHHHHFPFQPSISPIAFHIPTPIQGQDADSNDPSSSSPH